MAATRQGYDVGSVAVSPLQTSATPPRHDAAALRAVADGEEGDVRKRLKHPIVLLPPMGETDGRVMAGDLQPPSSPPVLAVVPVVPARPPATRAPAAPSQRSLGARLAASALALAVEPDLSIDVAVTGLIVLSQGSTTALEGALRRIRWRQLVRSGADADAATRLLRAALRHLGAGNAEAAAETGRAWWSSPQAALERGGRQASHPSAPSPS
jgi:hypothetical protein